MLSVELTEELIHGPRPPRFDVGQPFPDCCKRRLVLAAAIIGLASGAGFISLVALNWLGFLGLPPVFFLTLLLVGMPLGGLLLVRVRKLKKLSISSVALISGGLAVASAVCFLLAIQWTNARFDLNLEMSALLTNLL